MNLGLAAPGFTRGAVGFLRGQIVDGPSCPVEVGDEKQWLAWLTDETIQIGRGRDGLATALMAHYRAKNVDPPGPEQARGVATRALQDFEMLLCQQITDRLGDAADKLDAVPQDPAQWREWSFLRDKVDPIDLRKLIQEIDNLKSLHALGLPTEMLTKLDEDPANRDLLGGLLQVLDKYAALRASDLPVEVFDGVPAALVEAWSARAANLHPVELRAHPRVARVTLLCALCFVRRKEITDLLGQVFVGLLHQIQVRVEQRIANEYVETQWSGAARDALLIRLAEAAVDHPDDTVRSALYPVASENLLRQLVLDSEAREVAETRSKRAVLRSTYCAYFQQVLELVLAGLEFRCLDVGCWPVMAALGELHGEYTSCWGGGRFYDPDQNIPLDDVVPPEWRAAVVDRNGRIERIIHELCVLLSLRELLCTRRVFLAGAGIWGRPGVDWPAGDAAGHAGSEPEQHITVSWPAWDQDR